MTALAEKTGFLKHWDRFNGKRFSPYFEPLRQSARARFQDLPFPTARTEDWRFTSVTGLLGVPFEAPQSLRVDRQALPTLPPGDANCLVFVNGAFSGALSNIGNVPAGIKLGSLAQAGAETAERLKAVMGLASFQDQVFTALNTSLFDDGAYIIVEEGRVVPRPIELWYLSSPGQKNLLANPRTLIALGKNSQATIVERFLPADPLSALGQAGAYFTNAVTEIVLGERSILDHYKIQKEDTNAYHIAVTQVAQGAASSFSTHYFAMGGGLVRNDVRVRFDGEHSEATVNGLYLAGDTQHIDNFTVIDHAKANCASHELYKGILSDQAHGVFNGKIFVRPDAQKTDAKQTNKVLLLSDGATINTKPQLEIFADDVKCTHGATVGQLDDEQIFYLRTRGIDEKAARGLLTYAFANDVIGRVKINALREELEQKIIHL
ncbi:MAG: Fe-S cluster assembly protein SufD [Gemmataceae bacterium]|nr:Fe-S cluster assembly protein SufD [Gemmataceae bacterium]